MIAVGRVLSKANFSIGACVAKRLTSGQQSVQSFRKMSCVCPELQALPKVDIDSDGIFKYILLRVHGKEPETQDLSVTIVRGYRRCNYHSDIYEEVQSNLPDLDCEPIGGGRISHDCENKTIHIYGYSQGYGKADHEITAKLIKEAYPNYKVTISDEGY